MKILSAVEFAKIADVAWGDNPEEYADPEDLFAWLVEHYKIDSSHLQDFLGLYDEHQIKLCLIKPLPKLLADFGLFLGETFHWTSNNVHTNIEFFKVYQKPSVRYFLVSFKIEANTDIQGENLGPRLGFALQQSELFGAAGDKIAELLGVEVLSSTELNV